MSTLRSRVEEIFVLYGSQTGNSEQAAKDFCRQVATRLSPKVIHQISSTPTEIIVKPTHMQLDDFLELERAKWTRIVVIIVSSYGIGQAPLGSYRFRELCDVWLDTYPTNAKILDGLFFAICGLGDSKYTTFLENPTTIDKALHRVGAKRVGELGKADASGTGENAQGVVIERWMDGIWSELAKAVAQEPLSKEKLQMMQKETVDICQKINPDFISEEASDLAAKQRRTSIAVLIACLAILSWFIFQ